MQKYSKFLVAVLGAVVTIVVQDFGQNKYVQILVALLTALGVYQVRNTGA
jgi:uncharacterized membrane protein